MSKELIELVSFKRLLSSNSDDLVDKLNHNHTTTILIIFAVVVMSSQLVGPPIVCWVPAEFTGAFKDYANAYCWIKNTYFVPMDDTIPMDINARSNAEITYYQWVPLILLFMAFMFKFPNIMWKLMNTHTGFSFKNVSKLAKQASENNKNEGKEAISNLARLIDVWIRSQRQYKHNFLVKAKGKIARVVCIYCSKREGQFLSALYFNAKVLYVFNVIGQFFLLNAFLGMDYNSFGYNILDGLANAEEWPESPRFPRITLCDFRIRQLQNIQRYTVQCVLPINLFNEKIFIFLWFWLFFVAVASTINLTKWFVILVVKRNNYRFVKKYLKITSNVKDAVDKKIAHRFVDKYLRDDGCFVLRMLGKNASDLVVIDLVEELWINYKDCPTLCRTPKDEDECKTYVEKDDTFEKKSFLPDNNEGQRDRKEDMAYRDLPFIEEESQELVYA